MKHLGNLLKKDLILGIKDVMIIMEITFSILTALFLLFLVPKEVKNDAIVFVYDQPKLIESFVFEFDPDIEEDGEYYVNSREEVIKGIIEHKSAVGLIVEDAGDGRYNTTLLTQPYTTKGMIDYIDIDIEDILSILHPPYGIYPQEIYEMIEVEALQLGRKDDIPFNQRMVPSLIYMMVGIMGMFAMVSLVGQEREDMTLRAYRVSPADLSEFLTSKHLTILITGFFSFSFLYIPVIGLTGYLYSLLIIILTIYIGSCVGIIFGSFFSSAMEAISWIMLLMIILSLPAVSLFIPIFSPVWLKFIPSYYSLFALEAAMLPDNNVDIIYRGLIVLTGISLIMTPISISIFRSVIRKEA